LSSGLNLLTDSSVTSKIGEVLALQTASGEATSKLSTDLEHDMEKIWQHLDTQIESVIQQLAERAEENGMMSELYRRKEAECQQHLEKLASLQDTVEKQADHIRDLEEAESSFAFLQQDNEDLERRVTALKAESTQLKEEVQSKTIELAEARAKLDTAKTTHATEAQNYKSTLEALNKTIQEQDRKSETAIAQAVEKARREAQAEAQAKADRIQKEKEQALQDVQLERQSLLENMEGLKKKVHEYEQRNAQDADTVKALQDRLTAEEEKKKLVTQQLAQRNAAILEMENKLGGRASHLETDLKAALERAAHLEDETRRERSRTKAVISGLELWVEREGRGLDGLRFLKDDNMSAEAIRDGLVQLLGELLRSRGLGNGARGSLNGESPRDNIAVSSSNPSQGESQNARPAMDDDSQRTIPDSQGQEAANDSISVEPPQYAKSLDHMRRVVVRSPANVPNEPTVPSVDQEKTRRREAVQPKPIMKRATRSPSTASQREDLLDTAGHGAFKRSTPGDKPSEVPGPSQAEPMSSTNSQGSSGNPVPEEANPRGSKKRRRSDTAETEQPASSNKRPQRSKTRGVRTPDISSTVGSVGSTQPVPLTIPQGGSQGDYHRQPTTSTFLPPQTRNSQKMPGSSSQPASRSASVGSAQRPGSRPANLRTYRSQRAADETSEAAGNRSNVGVLMRPESQSSTATQFLPLMSQSQSQSQSRYFSQTIHTQQGLMTV
jgi:hypothetical protein